ncbi:fungal-specific transcription factor domain-containing protein [Penicillium cf. viridicatum]|uniref:Fungal-specific transcription factor domain-containing protein n=1 Tax=Penicillium cf. viridicatum TaxID=2972119 RepID=A0A9W9MU61_9EURO|nr:fungal-specific transcription factor domain-containing protein [Penicillium cf. viridicatum]
MENIGRFYRMMAYRHLRAAMTGSMKNIEELQNVMSATLSLITIDIMEGGMSELGLHLKGFKRLQILSNRLQSPIQKLCKTERYLKTVFYCQSTLSRSTDCGLPPLPWPSHLLESDAADESIDNHCLQHTYGVTHTLLRFIHNIKTLSRHLAYYSSRGLNLPDALERERAAVGEKLLLWNIECEEIVLFDESEAAHLAAKITKLHVLAFSYAIQVFYMTHLVLPVDLGELSNGEIAVKLQHQVSCVASCLRKIEVIKRDNPGVFRKPMAPIMWPGYIASCEAEPEDRGLWLEWWEGMLRYRIGNIQPLWNAVQGTWRSRDEDAFGLSGRGEGSSDSQCLSRCLPLWRGFLRGRQDMIFAL